MTKQQPDFIEDLIVHVQVYCFNNVIWEGSILFVVCTMMDSIYK